METSKIKEKCMNIFTIFCRVPNLDKDRLARKGLVAIFSLVNTPRRTIICPIKLSILLQGDTFSS